MKKQKVLVKDAAGRYRFKGKFISEKKFNQLSNLKQYREKKKVKKIKSEKVKPEKVTKGKPELKPKPKERGEKKHEKIKRKKAAVSEPGKKDTGKVTTGKVKSRGKLAKLRSTGTGDKRKYYIGKRKVSRSTFYRNVSKRYIKENPEPNIFTVPFSKGVYADVIQSNWVQIDRIFDPDAAGLFTDLFEKISLKPKHREILISIDYVFDIDGKEVHGNLQDFIDFGDYPYYKIFNMIMRELRNFGLFMEKSGGKFGKRKRTRFNQVGSVKVRVSYMLLYSKKGKKKK